MDGVKGSEIRARVAPSPAGLSGGTAVTPAVPQLRAGSGIEGLKPRASSPPAAITPKPATTAKDTGLSELPGAALVNVYKHLSAEDVFNLAKVDKAAAKTMAEALPPDEKKMLRVSLIARKVNSLATFSAVLGAKSNTEIIASGGTITSMPKKLLGRCVPVLIGALSNVPVPEMKEAIHEFSETYRDLSEEGLEDKKLEEFTRHHLPSTVRSDTDDASKSMIATEESNPKRMLSNLKKSAELCGLYPVDSEKETIAPKPITTRPKMRVGNSKFKQLMEQRKEATEQRRATISTQMRNDLS
jgi:hypothetical protein